MMKESIKKTGSVEIEAITVEEAFKKALKELHATKEEVTIQVLKEEQKGLFGMQGAETAKIRVSLKQHSSPKK